MKFTDIDEESSVFPGEYLLHKPSQAIVMAGAFNREEDLIRAFKYGKLFEDKILNFQKLNWTRPNIENTDRSDVENAKGREDEKW